MRLTRSSMLEVLRQDYIRTARAKGASDTVRQLRPCAAQRRAAGRHHHRHRGRLPDRRPDRHRDRVQHPGRGALPGGGHPLARLPDRAEPGDVHRRRRGGRQLHRRHDCTSCSTRASSTRSEAHVAVIDHDAELARAGANVRGWVGAAAVLRAPLSAGRHRRADHDRCSWPPRSLPTPSPPTTRSRPTRAPRWPRPATSTSARRRLHGPRRVRAASSTARASRSPSASAPPRSAA